MKSVRTFVCGAGIVTAAGMGLEETWEAVCRGTSCIAPLTLFPTSHVPPLPVGEIRIALPDDDLPRTHALALLAAREAMAGTALTPDAIVLGVTTGGMPVTEILMQKGEVRTEQYRYHATGSVAACLAERLHCRGPVMTVSTACSSGTAAMKIALELIRCGQARVVLAGGADALCRMTYYGFHALQLIDPTGAHPLDINRQGLSVAEGAAFLLLVGTETAPDGAFAELAGAALSCDAHHPAAPHPEGDGALAAMQAALADAGMTAGEIDYINLHGTGTVDNDLAEAKAVRALCGDRVPPVSSVKGLFGHTLGASGAIEAVVSALSISRSFVPANVGCRVPDPVLGLKPILQGQAQKVRAVMSNSFGFGGNNASLLLTEPLHQEFPARQGCPVQFSVLGASCLTGAGAMEDTLARFRKGETFRGRPNLGTIRTDIPAGSLRRLKRLSRMTLLLALKARQETEITEEPGGIFFGTAWGALTETNDFLSKLFSSAEKFTSPTDFVGSVHNAPASQAAIFLEAHGPNITVTGGDHSFEQALFTAGLIMREGDAPAFVMAAEEYHDELSPRLDPFSTVDGGVDGGAAFYLRPERFATGLRLVPSSFAFNPDEGDGISNLIENLGGSERICKQFGAIFAGLPAAGRSQGEALLNRFRKETAFAGSTIDYRRLTGEFAGASAVAAALAIDTVRRGCLPSYLTEGKETTLEGKGILLLGLGEFITAIEVLA